MLIFIYLSMRMHSLYEFCYRTFIYIQQECRSVLVKLHPITFYRTVILFYFFLFLFFFLFFIYLFIYLFFLEGGFLGRMPLFVFFDLPIVSCSMTDSVILGCLRPWVFLLNNSLILGIWSSAIAHLPGCF